jgi:alanine racemase
MQTRTWAEISLPRLRHNYREIRRRVGERAAVMAVVKAGAYGHGAPTVARTLAAEGAEWFGVTTVEEGRELRAAGIAQPILLLSGFAPGEADQVEALRLTPAVYDAQQAGAMESRGLPYHLKVDTGLGRLGFDPAAVVAGPHLEGLLTHLASADQPDDPRARRQTDDQIRRFAELRARIPARWYHLANSAALATRADCWGNLVRPGLALYGYLSCPSELDLRPVLSFKARVLAVREAAAGTPVGYGARYVTPGPARLAVIGAGYADGLSRRLTNGGQALVRGRRCPIAGAVSMDLTMLDVSAAPDAAPGDVATLIGEDGAERITAQDVAALTGSISYEVLCQIGNRVPRVYLD